MTLHMDVTRWSILKSDWLYSLQPKMENQQKQHCKLTVAQNMMISLLQNSDLKWKKVGKTTRPFKDGLYQILYDYTVGVTNRFKELDLKDRVPEELWMEVCNILQEVVIKTIPKRIAKKAKWLSEEALQIAEKRREEKGKGEKKDIPIWTKSSWSEPLSAPGLVFADCIELLHLWLQRI